MRPKGGSASEDGYLIWRTRLAMSKRHYLYGHLHDTLSVATLDCVLHSR